MNGMREVRREGDEFEQTGDGRLETGDRREAIVDMGRKKHISGLPFLCEHDKQPLFYSLRLPGELVNELFVNK
ncbi:hypothetical protein HZA56_15000 [Candidatus Poribacteria bacterium]|nr:hypothetical protein [Candidatus Poribacteria bacterium]